MWTRIRELKGTLSRDFLLLVFSMNQFPPAAEYPIRTISNFFENTRRYAQVKVHHQYQRHRWQILPPVSLVLLTLAASCHRFQQHRQKICHRCQRQRWQIMGTISGCRHLKVNLKAKIYICVNSTTQRCPNKIIKIFLIEGFFHLPPVSMTPVVQLEQRISPWIFEKIWNGCNGVLECLRENDSLNKPEVENLMTLSV